MITNGNIIGLSNYSQLPVNLQEINVWLQCVSKRFQTLKLVLQGKHLEIYWLFTMLEFQKL